MSFSYSQNVKETKTENQITKNQTFEEFVNQNALSIFNESVLKSSNCVEIILNVENPLLSDLNLYPLEDRAQYFRIKGTDKLLKIESLYRLRLMYQSKK
jgi:hypothetical protein